MSLVYLGLGTNLGERAGNLARAVELLAAIVEPAARSCIYESEPVGYTTQPLFLNQVLAARTALLPTALLRGLKEIERVMGREPGFTNGPRLIDLDLLLYDDWIFGGDGLIIPHPRMGERSFVLAPLAGLAPETVHPMTGMTIGGMWDAAAGRLARSWPYKEEVQG